MSKKYAYQFDDVNNCQNMEEFNAFIAHYLAERELSETQKKTHYWILLHQWLLNALKRALIHQ